MDLPQEIEVWYTIPAIRRELAQRLVKAGLTQRDVAKKLGVTEAAISQYLSNKRGTPVQYPALIQTALEKAVTRILNNDEPVIIRNEINALAKLMKEHKVICTIHEKHGFDAQGCKSCFE